MAATAGSFAVELVYLFLAVAAIRLLMRSNGVWWQYLIIAVAVATPVLGFYGALNPKPHDTTNLNWLALYWALGVVLLSAIWFGVVRVLRRGGCGVGGTGCSQRMRRAEAGSTRATGAMART